MDNEAVPAKRTTKRRKRRSSHLPLFRFDARTREHLRRELWAAPPPLPADKRRGARWRVVVCAHLLPLGAFLALTMVLTYPLVLHFGTLLPGDYSDGWQNYWNYWWLSRAVRAGENPYWTPLLYAPYG